MKPTRFSLILIKGGNMTPWVQTGKNNLEPRLVLEGALMALVVAVHHHHSILIAAAAVFPTSSRHFLAVLTQREGERARVCAMTYEGARGIILTSLWRCCYQRPMLEACASSIFN